MAETISHSETSLKLRPFQAEDYVGLVKLRNLLFPDHPASIESMRHRDNTRDKKIRHKRWVWEIDSHLVCLAMYSQFEEAYHPQKFEIKTYVHPEYQGKGLGRACYEYLMQELVPLDPIKITCIVHEPHQQAVRFLEKRGFKYQMQERESCLDLTRYDPAQYDEEINRVTNQGFRFTTLAEFRKEDDQADYKAWELERDVGPDLPWTDPIEIPEYEQYERHILNHPKFNPDSWFFVLDGNRIAGLNNLWKSEIPKVINTGLTGVRREYRRKGIATALKHTCLNWAKDAGFEQIRTDNAASNEGMLSINIKVGFKFMPAWLVYEKVLREES